jgi:hypothetical protein
MKKLLLLMMVLTAVLALGACAGTQPGDTSTAAGAAATAGTATTETNAGESGTGTMGTGTPAAGSTAAVGTAAAAAQGGPGGPCSNVRCAACPEGQTPALRPPDCCACVPVDTSITDCSTVRCAACPEGKRPALTPPNCCRCIPN